MASNYTSVYKTSLFQCAQTFYLPICCEQVIYFIINSIILLLTTIILIQRLKDQTLYRIPKIKTVILISMWFSLSSYLIFSISINFHWAIYLHTLFDYCYFIWIIYYFGKKCLKVTQNIHLMLKYKIFIGVIFSAYTINFIVNNIMDDHQQRYLCYQMWYTYARFFGLGLQVVFCGIGLFIYRKLSNKLKSFPRVSLDFKNMKRIQQKYQQLHKIIRLMITFFVSQIALLAQALYYQFLPQDKCQFFPNSIPLNIIITFIISFFGNFLPKIMTLNVFKLKKQQSRDDYLRKNTDESTQNRQKMQMIYLRANTLKESVGTKRTSLL